MAKKKLTPPGDEYYAAMRQRKVDAGLSLADATAVTEHQREEDAANGFSLEPEGEDPESPATPPASDGK